jgi:hypothetical protein
VEIVADAKNGSNKDQSESNQNREPILGVSIYDERNLKFKVGPKLKKLDKFINYKLEEGFKKGGAD